MGRREGDLAICLLRFQVSLLVIYGTGGSFLNPPNISPTSPKAFVPIIHVLAPSMPSSPPTPTQHKSPGPISSQGSQTPNIFNKSDHDISSSNADPPSTKVKSGEPIAPASAPRIELFSPPIVQQNIPRIAPSVVPSRGPESFEGPVMSLADASLTETSSDLSPANHSQVKGSPPVISPQPHESNCIHAPSISHPPPPEESIRKSPQPVPATSVPVHKKGKIGDLAPTPFSLPPSLAPSALHEDAPFPKVKRNHVPRPVVSPSPVHPPFEVPKNKRRHFALPPDAESSEVNLAPSHPQMPMIKTKISSYAPSPQVEGPMAKMAYSHPHVEIPKKHFFPSVQAPISSPSGEESATPVSSPTTRQKHNIWPISYPAPSPSYFRRKSESPLPQPILSLPPPPPNLNCGPITCQEPLANPALGSPCTCVLPIKVGLSLGVALYTFFPLVSEFAQEIASAVFVKQSQVRIMGANAAFEDPERTVVLIDLVPLGKYFDNTTVFQTYEKFWHKQVTIQASYFGDYDVSYVLYPGLPPAPPAAPANINVEGGAYRNDNNGRVIRPLGVDVRKKKGKIKLNGSLISVIVLLSVISLVLIIGVAGFLLSRYREHSDLPSASSQSIPRFAKLSDARTAPMTAGNMPSSTSAPFSSGFATYTGTSKKFSLYMIEKITNNFDNSRIIGEGGFGRVYQGTIEDGTRVAVKALKRDDHQGEREFLAEVEMLSRLHHRNLVKLIGICSEENTRCLIYELIPNGSVESHLHGVDKDIAPLDWHARMKIALGAARGLAYLHEDSYPKVIHRDFKSSNILLEHDFTPKVSDFGLARTALDEGNEHISTRVMGTFGYVAPEYAMTGHLLVKSDVYSYGVVLLELLTGRKPVDMSQPPGQENLVSWARPLLTKVERVVDPALGNNYDHDSIAKVMAIASMCVEPEVSHRPFMGEVVQALKLVCSENDECRHSESCSNDRSSIKEMGVARVDINLCRETERVLSQSDMLYTSEGYMGRDDASGLFRLHSSSGPMGTGRSRHFWQRVGLESRSVNEHRWSRSEHGERWPKDFTSFT